MLTRVAELVVIAPGAIPPPAKKNPVRANTSGLVSLIALTLCLSGCTQSRYQVMQSEYSGPNDTYKRAILLDTQTGETWKQTFERGVDDSIIECWRPMPQKP